MVRTDRTYPFAQGPSVVWAAVTRCEDYRSWWPWLRRFEATAGFTEGSRWSCEVKAPTPWSLRFVISLDEVRPGDSVRATVTGDIEGSAAVTFRPAPEGGSVIRLVSDLAPASTLLKAVATAARPLVLWGHEWVLDQGVAQLRREALAPPEPPPDRPR